MITSNIINGCLSSFLICPEIFRLGGKCVIAISCLKDSQMRFSTYNFFLSIIRTSWAIDQWVKMSSILPFWLRNRRVIKIFQSPWGMIPLRVNLKRVWYPGESISPKYISFPGESIKNPLKHDSTECQLIPRRVNLPGVSYPSLSVF